MYRRSFYQVIIGWREDIFGRDTTCRVLASAALLMIGLLLAACGVVDIRVEETLTPVALPTATAFQQSSPSGQALSYGADDDKTMVVRTIAYPHIVLSANGISIELFQQSLLEREYLAIDSGYAFRLRTDWRALWLEDIHGFQSVTMEVYLQPPWNDEYEYWDYVSTEDREAWGADFQNELLDSTIWLSDPGLYSLRVVLTIKGRLDEQPEQTQTATLETELVLMSKPVDDPPLENEYFQPVFGELENQQVFPDWRSWAFGPCAVTTDNQTVTRLLDEACVAVENGDLDTTITRLQQSLDEEQNPRVLAVLRGQLGMLAAVFGQFNIGARHFREALNLWQAEDDALGTASSLHNLGILTALSGRWNEGEYWLNQSAQLQTQISDWVGGMLTGAQLSVYWGATEYADYIIDQLNERGLPQAEPLQAWLDATYADATATAVAQPTAEGQ
jgi:hypothetical protein